MSTAPTAVPDFSGELPDPAAPDSFTERGLAWWNYERYTMVPGVRNLADNAYENALAAEAAAGTAEALSGASMWSAATNYATGSAAISPTNGQTYRRKSPGGVDATDPSASSNWWLVGGTAFQKAGDTLAGDMLVAATAQIGAADMGLPSHNNVYTAFQPIFRTPATNAASYVGAVPSGTGNGSGFYGFAQSGGTIWGGLTVSTTGVRIHSTDQSAAAAQNVIFAFDGTDKAGVSKDGVFYGYGVKGRQGTSGTVLGNPVNLYWNGASGKLEVWVDTTKIGTINFTTGVVAPT